MLVRWILRCEQYYRICLRCCSPLIVRLAVRISHLPSCTILPVAGGPGQQQEDFSRALPSFEAHDRPSRRNNMILRYLASFAWVAPQQLPSNRIIAILARCNSMQRKPMKISMGLHLSCVVDFASCAGGEQRSRGSLSSTFSASMAR